MNTVRLRDEWGQGAVSVWSLSESIAQKRTVPEGTVAHVLSRSANGYVVILVGKEAFEVWHENISSNYSLN